MSTSLTLNTRLLSATYPPATSSKSTTLPAQASSKSGNQKYKKLSIHEENLCIKKLRRILQTLPPESDEAKILHKKYREMDKLFDKKLTRISEKLNRYHIEESDSKLSIHEEYRALKKMRRYLHPLPQDSVPYKILLKEYRETNKSFDKKIIRIAENLNRYHIEESDSEDDLTSDSCTTDSNSDTSDSKTPSPKISSTVKTFKVYHDIHTPRKEEDRTHTGKISLFDKFLKPSSTRNREPINETSPKNSPRLPSKKKESDSTEKFLKKLLKPTLEDPTFIDPTNNSREFKKTHDDIAKHTRKTLKLLENLKRENPQNQAGIQNGEELLKQLEAEREILKKRDQYKAQFQNVEEVLK